MTPRDVILSALRRQQDELIPFEFSGFNRHAAAKFRQQTGTSDPYAYFGCSTRLGHMDFEATKLNVYERFMPYHRLDPGLRYTSGQEPAQQTFYFNEFGTAHLPGSNEAYDHYTPPAVMRRANSLDAFEKYPMPDYEAPYRHEHLAEQAAQIKSRNLAVVAYMEMTIFERAWQIRGFEELMMDFYDQPDFAECLLDRIAAGSVFRARRYAQAGADIIRTGDDVSMQDRLMMSPAIWRKYLGPRLAKVFQAAKQVNPDIRIFYHSDGNVTELIEDLIEIGMDVLNPVQPECMDVSALKKRFGSRLSFWGTIGLQRALAFGKPDDVEAEVRQCVEQGGTGGGLLLSPTHVLAPEVPLENIAAMFRAALRYGRRRQTEGPASTCKGRTRVD
jgi:uroporphyrinogen decarboxylase